MDAQAALEVFVLVLRCHSPHSLLLVARMNRGCHTQPARQPPWEIPKCAGFSCSYNSPEATVHYLPAGPWRIGERIKQTHSAKQTSQIDSRRLQACFWNLLQAWFSSFTESYSPPCPGALWDNYFILKTETHKQYLIICLNFFKPFFFLSTKYKWGRDYSLYLVWRL